MAVVVHHRAHSQCNPLDSFDAFAACSREHSSANRSTPVTSNCRYVGSKRAMKRSAPRSCADVQLGWEDAANPPANGEYYITQQGDGEGSVGGSNRQANRQANRSVAMYCDFSTWPAKTFHRCQHCASFAGPDGDHRVFGAPRKGDSNYDTRRPCANPAGLFGQDRRSLVLPPAMHDGAAVQQQRAGFNPGATLDEGALQEPSHQLYSLRHQEETNFTDAPLVAKCKQDCRDDPACRALSCRRDHGFSQSGAPQGDPADAGSGWYYKECFLYSGALSEPCKGAANNGVCNAAGTIVSRGGDDYWSYNDYMVYTFDKAGAGLGECYRYRDSQAGDTTHAHHAIDERDCCAKQGMRKVAASELSAGARAFYEAAELVAERGRYGSRSNDLHDADLPGGGADTTHYCVPRAGADNNEDFDLFTDEDEDGLAECRCCECNAQCEPGMRRAGGGAGGGGGGGGGASCETCAAGRFSEGVDAPDCTPCPSGKFNSQEREGEAGGFDLDASRAAYQTQLDAAVAAGSVPAWSVAAGPWTGPSSRVIDIDEQGRERMTVAKQRFRAGIWGPGLGGLVHSAYDMKGDARAMKNREEQAAGGGARTSCAHCAAGTWTEGEAGRTECVAH
jgi:hypothetical protein